MGGLLVIELAKEKIMLDFIKKNIRWVLVGLLVLLVGSCMYVHWETINQQMTHPYANSEEEE